MTHRLVLLFAALFGSLGCGGEASPPRLVLWAWDRAEDLRFLAPGEADVAYLAGTITLLPDGRTRWRGRKPALRIPEGTRLVATVRIEEQGARLADDPKRLSALAELIAAQRLRPHVSEVQLDFDAVASERPAYRQLLEAVRLALPEKFPLTITGLASWCLRDDWARALPIDAIVPQLFRMGPEGGEARLLIASGFAPANPLCAQALGVATDEPKDRWETPAVWIFSPKAWTAEAFASARAELSP